MAACEQAGLRWGETPITEMVIAHAAEAVSVVPFTQPAEALSGADWVWWWVDHRGAYGMLVQAKRVTIQAGRWHFDFSYPNRTSTQRKTLMSTASALGLVPAYALYLGTADYRDWAPCPDGHRRGRCLQCVKRSVSLTPALLADELLMDHADEIYDRSVAIEDLLAPSMTAALLGLSRGSSLAPELAEFLTTRQDGTRAVARSMIDRVLAVRTTQLQHGATSSVAAKPETDDNHDRLGPVFTRFPDDRGHWGLSYFEHILSPYVQSPPGYALAAASGEAEPERLMREFPENVAGVVVTLL